MVKKTEKQMKALAELVKESGNPSIKYCDSDFKCRKWEENTKLLDSTQFKYCPWCGGKIL